jgi:thioredoxin-like negative regulator of GroEL
MSSMTMVLFRDGPGDGADALAGILTEIARSRTGRYSVAEVDVHDRPWLAALYNVRTTPTILLVKNGQVLDRVVGTPTRILLHNLLDTRTAPQTATSGYDVA